MKLPRLVLLFALLGALFASAVTASADESKMSQLQTSLSNTTISGYVESYVVYNVQVEHLNWWQRFLLWLGIHER